MNFHKNSPLFPELTAEQAATYNGGSKEINNGKKLGKLLVAPGQKKKTTMAKKVKKTGASDSLTSETTE